MVPRIHMDSKEFTYFEKKMKILRCFDRFSADLGHAMGSSGVARILFVFVFLENMPVSK